MWLSPGNDVLPYVVALARKHYEQIGFLPEPKLLAYANSGQLWIEHENGEPCGFLVWGNGWPVLRVYQVCIQYDAQRLHHGLNLVGRLIRKAEQEGYSAISCWVADDIPANDFWRAVGFVCVGKRKGGAKRERKHISWRYECANPKQLKLIS